MISTRARKLLRWCAATIACGLMALVLAGGSLQAATSLRSDEQLFLDALTAYNDGDWLKAAMELHAYIERDPVAMQTNSTHAKQAEDALDYALYMLNWHEENWETLLENANERARDIKASCEDQCDDVLLALSTVQGLSNNEPMPALSAPAEQSTRSYPIICRGGGDLEFSYAASSKESPRPRIEITFDKGGRGAGVNGEHIERMAPGECAFIDRGIRATEPDTLLFGYPILGPDEFLISWTAEGNASPLRPDYLRTLRMAHASYELFHVYNSRDGYFTVTKHGVIVAMLKVDSGRKYAIGHENLNGLTTGTRVYTDRNYTFSSVPAFLEGATFIQTANNDKGSNDGLGFLTLQTNRKTYVYVAHDDRYASKPTWMSSYVKMSNDLKFHDGRRTVVMSLYRKTFEAGLVSLGGNVRPGERGNHGMYAVVIAAAK